MKPPPFTYHSPVTLDEAIGLLARLENAKVLAGGQSLMPMLNMRIAAPDHVVDINPIRELAGIELRGERLFIGAMTRQRDIERSPVVKLHCPLLSEAYLLVGHRQTRNRGTLGGSLCHMDGASEQPAVALAHDAVIQVAGPRGTREIPMAQFGVSYLTTALDANEIMTGALLSVWPERHGYAFVEYARRHGDFAIVGVAVMLTLDGQGRIDRACVVLCGVGPTPVRVTEAEQLLIGRQPGAQAFTGAVEVAGRIEATSDALVSAEYRQHLAGVLVERALIVAANRAGR